MDHYAYLIWSLGYMAVWFGLFLANPTMRKPMVVVGLLTAPLGLAQPFSVPAYWNPPHPIRSGPADRLRY